MNIEQAKQKVEEITNDAAARLVAGILSKNVLLHIKGIGFSDESSSAILRVAECRANDMSHYKIGKYSKEYKYSA
jgi:hypothetical protein